MYITIILGSLATIKKKKHNKLSPVKSTQTLMYLKSYCFILKLISNMEDREYSVSGFWSLVRRPRDKGNQ